MTGLRREKNGSIPRPETISGDAKCGVMMEFAPSTALKVPQAQFLFQFQIISFGDPALLSYGSKFSQSDAGPDSTARILWVRRRYRATRPAAIPLLAVGFILLFVPQPNILCSTTKNEFIAGVG